MERHAAHERADKTHFSVYLLALLVIVPIVLLGLRQMEQNDYPAPSPPDWWTPEKEAKLQKEVTIGILSTAKFHHQIKQSAMESWWTEERRKMVTVFSDSKRPASANIPNVWDTNCLNTYVEGLWCKNAAMIEYWKKSEAHKDVKWFFRIMDDSYLHLENLLDLVEQYDPTEKIVLGDLYCMRENYTYPSGGPGILFSRAVLDDWNWDDWMAPLVIHDRNRKLMDDVMWGEYLNRRKIPIINHPGISQSPLDPGGELLDFMLQFRYIPWALPFRPVAIHQQKRVDRMPMLHQLLHSIPYTPTATQMIELPPCTCRNGSHQKCTWNHDLVDRGVCRWASQSLICLGPGPWPNLQRHYGVVGSDDMFF